MAKKKQKKHWSKQNINSVLFFAAIITFLFFCVFAVYEYSIPAIGIPLESNIEFNFQNLQNLFSTWFSLPHSASTSIPPKNHMTVETVKIPTFIYDLLGHKVLPQITTQPLPHHEYPPGAIQITQLPNISPDKLVVIRPQDKIDNLPAFTKTITNQVIVKKLYDDISNLPFPPSGTISCPIQFFEQYTLFFSLHGTVVLQGTFNPTGCRIIQIQSGKARWAITKQGSQFIQDFQNALMLTNLEFYGSQNGRPLWK